MVKKKWISIIRKNCKEIGTYEKAFDPIIETLSAILERRDNARDEFERSGSHSLVERTNKAGATNIEQNPLIRLINDYDSLALNYWKELGLTAKSLRSIKENALSDNKQEVYGLEKMCQLLEGNLSGNG